MTAKSTTAKLQIMGEITTATADAFVDSVEACRDAEITVLVDSSGGDMGGAFRMANALTASKARTTAVLLRADSASLFASLGCDRRIVANDGSAHLHDMALAIPRAVSRTVSEMRAGADRTECTQREACRALEVATGTRAGVWQSLMALTSKLDAREMAQHGLVDGISQWSQSRLREEHFAAAAKPGSPPPPSRPDWAQRLETFVAKALSAPTSFDTNFLASAVRRARHTLWNARRLQASGHVVELAQHQVDAAEGALRGVRSLQR